MKFKLYLLLLIFTSNFSATFLEKLAKQSTPTKAVLAIAAIFPLLHGAHIQYHLRYQHNKPNECFAYSRHYLQNYPYFNLLFFLNSLITSIRKYLYKKTHEGIACCKTGCCNICCYFNRKQTDTDHLKECPEDYRKEHYNLGIFNGKEMECSTNNLLRASLFLDFFSLLFLLGKSIHIAYQS
jgi:hypothetical protein